MAAFSASALPWRRVAESLMSEVSSEAPRRRVGAAAESGHGGQEEVHALVESLHRLRHLLLPGLEARRVLHSERERGCQGGIQPG
jgi:hypothetical protein